MSDADSRLMNLSGDDAVRAWKLAHGLDLQLEACQHRGYTADRTMDEVAPWIMGRIGASALVIRLVGDGETWKALSYGEDPTALNRFAIESGDREIEDGLMCSLPLLMHDETIGTIAAQFPEDPGSPGGTILLEVASQELDNILYELRRARFRHVQVLEICRRLQHHVLDKSIDTSAYYLFEQIDAEAIVVAYREDQGEESGKSCRVYRDGAFERKYSVGDGSPIGTLFHQEENPSAHRILEVAGIRARSVGSARIEAGLTGSRDHGIVIATGPETSVTGSNLELIQNFAMTLGQRLVDYHKDRRYLQQFFSAPVVSRLLTYNDYHERFLSPRLQDVAMLYTDITSFTKISEQILSTPQEVGELIDHWSDGVVQILFEHGGVFDKMVGDCVIGLFGTPFEDDGPAERVANAITAAREISRYTSELAGKDVIDKIRGSDMIPGLGVATGVNHGTVMVGTFGPNNDFTAFGREMNNTARLQGVAGYREILVMESARKALKGSSHALDADLPWGDLCEASVKNVREPLRYYPILGG